MTGKNFIDKRSLNFCMWSSNLIICKPKLYIEIFTASHCFCINKCLVCITFKLTCILQLQSYSSATLQTIGTIPKIFSSIEAIALQLPHTLWSTQFRSFHQLICLSGCNSGRVWICKILYDKHVAASFNFGAYFESMNMRRWWNRQTRPGKLYSIAMLIWRCRAWSLRLS